MNADILAISTVVLLSALILRQFSRSVRPPKGPTLHERLFRKGTGLCHVKFITTRYGCYTRQTLPESCGTVPVLTSLDLDGTLVGSDDCTRQFNSVWIRTHAANSKSYLVYNSGRALEAYEALVSVCNKRWLHLLRPDFYIAAEGSDIFEFSPDSDEPKRWEEWREHLAKRWDVHEVRQIVAAHGLTHPANRPFPPGATTGEDFRVSMVIQGQGHAQELCEKLRNLFNDTVSKVQVMYCGGVYENGKCIPDRYWVGVSPAASGKGKALDFVRSKLKFDPLNTFAAGDSGNDVAMLGHETIASCGTMVSNAHGELRDWVAKINPTRKQRILISSRPYGSGILDGLTHFGFLR